MTYPLSLTLLAQFSWNFVPYGNSSNGTFEKTTRKSNLESCCHLPWRDNQQWAVALQWALSSIVLHSLTTAMQRKPCIVKIKSTASQDRTVKHCHFTLLLWGIRNYSTCILYSKKPTFLTSIYSICGRGIRMIVVNGPHQVLQKVTRALNASTHITAAGNGLMVQIL